MEHVNLPKGTIKFIHDIDEEQLSNAIESQFNKSIL